MAKIDMDALKKSAELKASAPIETKVESVELTDNAVEKTEDTNEIKQETADEASTEEAQAKVIVRYVGSGVWKDSHGKLWANENKTENILAERQYSQAEYKSREDIKFMVSYGAMKMTEVK